MKLYTLWCRLFQVVMKIGSDTIIPWRIPQVISGDGCVRDIAPHLQSAGLSRVLVVTDPGLMSLGLLGPMLDSFQAQGIAYALYDKTVANPTIPNVEEALALYHAQHCQGVVAFGGGSPMDCAKGVCARVARPKKPVQKMRGLMKILRKTPPLYAVPTTAGTGSETTLAAVVTDPSTREKYAINDPSLIPDVAVLDPLLTLGLPPHITSTTGMDALTHAVEAYIGRSNTKGTRQAARTATTLVFENLHTAYAHGDDHQARRNMQQAAFEAGVAFTRAYVGNVHAIAHTLGGFYGVPHGLANAVILPHVLAYYGETAHKPLAALGLLVGVSKAGDTQKAQAEAFIQAIRALNASMEIPETIEGIREEDIPAMVANAFREANPLYPVPMVFTREDFTKLYHIIQAH